MKSKYDIVRAARETSRLTSLDIVEALCQDYFELYGDRKMADDKAIVGGVGLMDGIPITFIGSQKGRDTQENIYRNFGAAGPAGYRKAQRLMLQAEKFSRPVLTLINTSGAYAAPESEQYGIGEAIASTLKVMAELTVPSLSIVVGEGGSGGAIALAVTDEVWMFENAIYTILSPEAFASILWKDNKLAAQAAEEMKLTSKDLLDLGVIERVIKEQENNEILSQEVLLASVVEQIKDKIKELIQMDQAERLAYKTARFRKF